jgi:hypothetical protein
MAKKKIKRTKQAITDSNEGYSVVSVILCDDVRREDNGKEILIGIYVGNMIVDTDVPALLPTFCIRIVIRWKEPGAHKVEGFIIAPNGNLIVKFGGDLVLPPGQNLSSASFKVSPFIIPAFGNYEIKIGTQESEAITVETFEVVKRQPSGDALAMK